MTGNPLKLWARRHSAKPVQHDTQEDPVAHQEPYLGYMKALVLCQRGPHFHLTQEVSLLASTGLSFSLFLSHVLSLE